MSTAAGGPKGKFWDRSKSGSSSERSSSETKKSSEKRMVPCSLKIGDSFEVKDAGKKHPNEYLVTVEEFLDEPECTNKREYYPSVNLSLDAFAEPEPYEIRVEKHGGKKQITFDRKYHGNYQYPESLVLRKLSSSEKHRVTKKKSRSQSRSQSRSRSRSRARSHKRF